MIDWKSYVLRNKNHDQILAKVGKRDMFLNQLIPFIHELNHACKCDETATRKTRVVVIYSQIIVRMTRVWKYGLQER